MRRDAWYAFVEIKLKLSMAVFTSSWNITSIFYCGVRALKKCASASLKPTTLLGPLPPFDINHSAGIAFLIFAKRPQQPSGSGSVALV